MFVSACSVEIIQSVVPNCMKFEVITEGEVYFAGCRAATPCSLVDHLFGESISIYVV